MMNTPLVSIVIPVWKGLPYLQDCLDALLRSDAVEMEIIVVDNASPDGAADFITAHYPQVRLLRESENRGFAGGCNIGLRAARGDVLVLLNQDTVVSPSFLETLIRALTDRTIGIAGCKALYPDGTIQHAGGVVNIRGEGMHYGRGEVDVGQFDQSRDVDYVTGVGMALTRATLEMLGFLDEVFFPAYYEDVDWCYRVREAGLRVVYESHAVLIHRETSLGDFPTHEGMYAFHCNRLRFVLKHWPVERLASEFLSAEQTWLKNLDMGGERLIAVMHRAYLHQLLNLANLVNWRVTRLRDAPEVADDLARVLLTLRATVPLPTGEFITGDGGEGENLPAALVELRGHSALQERQLSLRVPAIGGLLAKVWRFWTRLSAITVYARPLAQQQVDFNIHAVRTFEQMKGELDHLTTVLDRLTVILEEYSTETGRELGDLARAIQQVRKAVDQKNR